VHVVKGLSTDPTALASAEPERAVHALIAEEDDGDVLVTALMLRRIAPALPLVALVRSEPVMAALGELGVRQAVSGERLIGHVVAKSLEAPHAGVLLLDLIDSEKHRLVEREVAPDEVGRPLSEVRGERHDLVLCLVRGEYLARYRRRPPP
jgi:voltage-gated potassium channel